jgi:hypothetical protein
MESTAQREEGKLVLMEMLLLLLPCTCLFCLPLFSGFGLRGESPSRVAICLFSLCRDRSCHTCGSIHGLNPCY